MESRFNKRAISPQGACGVMQVMPATGALYGITRRELFDADINIQVGLQYLKDMFNLFANQELALAAYNCGPERVIEADYRIPPHKGNHKLCQEGESCCSEISAKRNLTAG